VIWVCSIISVISASYYSEVNLHCFVKLLNFAVRGNVHYIWHWMVLSVVLPNVDTSVKILSTLSTIIRSREIKVLVTVQNSAANLTLTATCVAAVVFWVFRRISAAFRSTFLPTIHRELKKRHSSTPPVATTTSVSTGVCVHIYYETAATVARVSYKFKRISCNSTVCITN
jgi:hypothetical protein